MPNIKFSYFYRDAGNYKKWANVVFSNPDGLTLEAAMKALKGAFLQDGLFIAHQVRVPEVFLFPEETLLQTTTVSTNSVPSKQALKNRAICAHGQSLSSLQRSKGKRNVAGPHSILTTRYYSDY